MRAVVVGLGLCALVTASAVTLAQVADLTGAWVFSIQGDGAAITAQVTLKVDGGRIAGHVSSPLSGEQDFTGSVDGAAFEFSFPGDAGQMEFKGTAEASGLKGTFESAGTGAIGTFTAKRKE